jgi:hypothetical protein
VETTTATVVPEKEDTPAVREARDLYLATMDEDGQHETVDAHIRKDILNTLIPYLYSQPRLR